MSLSFIEFYCEIGIETAQVEGKVQRVTVSEMSDERCFEKS